MLALELEPELKLKIDGDSASGPFNNDAIVASAGLLHNMHRLRYSVLN